LFAATVKDFTSVAPVVVIPVAAKSAAQVELLELLLIKIIFY